MGIGVVGIQTSQKKEQAGPPFTSNSADNGLSVDPVSSHIVLGNDVGAVGAPAQLLSNREIITEDSLFNLFNILLNSIQTGVTTLLNGQMVQVFSNNGSAPTIVATDGASGAPTITASVAGGLGGVATVSAIAGAGDSALMALQAGAGGNTTIQSFVNGNIWNVTNSGTGNIFIGWSNFGIAIQGMFFYVATIQIQVGPTLTTKNAADFQISGTTTYRYAQQGQGAGAYNINRDLDSGKVFFNSAGATTFNIFNSAGANFREGFIFRLTVVNAAGVTIQAQAGEIIRFGSLATSVAGTITSTDVGAYIVLVLLNNGWVTQSFVGAWNLT
jgi:hypothetical protein